MRSFSFSIKFIAIALGAVSLTLVVAGWMIYQTKKDTLTLNSGAELLSRARTAAMMLNGESHALLVWDGNGNVANPQEFQSLRKTMEDVSALSQLHGASPFLHTYRRSADFEWMHELEMVLASGGGRSRSYYPGKRKMPDPQQLAALHGHTVHFGPYEDFDGRWISAVAPILDTQGRVCGLVQADLPAEVIHREATESLWKLLQAGGISMLLILLPVYLMGRKTSQQINSINKAMAAAAQGDYHRHVMMSRSPDIRPLVTQFNKLIQNLKRDRHATRKTIRDLEKNEKQTVLISRTKSSFMADVSHEMRTSVNTVMGLNEILLDTPLTPEQRRITGNMKENIGVLYRLWRDILDYWKIESGSLTFAEIEFNLPRLLESVLESYASEAHRKGLELSGIVDESVPELVRADPGRIRQVLSNLVGNAILETERGEVVLSLGASDVTDHSVLLHFSIRDTGMGQEHVNGEGVFDPWKCARLSGSQRPASLGLGLMVSKNIVETLEGSIGVESQSNHGSTFWFTMRLVLPEQSESSLVLDPDIVHGFRILIVEDNASVRKMIGNQLSQWGIRHEGVADGVDALRALHRNASLGIPFRLVLMDAHLEGMDASTLARTIQSDPALDVPQFVILTEVCDRPERLLAEEPAFWKCLRKPVKRDHLFELIQESLQTETGPAASPPCTPGSLPEPRKELPLERGAIVEPESARRPVLLAEDDRGNLELVRHHLKRLGYEPLTAADGTEALKIWQSSGVDIILMDCFMPAMDGYEATREIRRQFQADHSGKGLPPYIVALTARAMPGDREECIQAGMNDYVTKPIEIEELRSALQRAEIFLSGQHMDKAA